MIDHSREENGANRIVYQQNSIERLKSENSN